MDLWQKTLRIRALAGSQSTPSDQSEPWVQQQLRSLVTNLKYRENLAKYRDIDVIDIAPALSEELPTPTTTTIIILNVTC